MKKILIMLPESQSGGPYISHLRIMNSVLQKDFCFFPFYYPRCRKMLQLSFRKKLKNVIQSVNPDIIHCIGLQLDGYLQVLNVRKIVRKKKKILLAVHGSQSELTNASNFRRKLMSYLEKRQLQMCDYYYSVSQYSSRMEILRSFSHKSLGVVYNLPPTRAKEVMSKDLVRNELNIQQNDFVVVSTGRITKEKGFDVLAEIIVRMPKTIHFLIVGDGDYLEEMKRVTNGFSNVCYVGFVKDVTNYLLASDLFIICSKHETLCNSIIEAGSCGLAVLASNIGGIPEIVETGVSGYLFDCKDTNRIVSLLTDLINDESKRVSFGEALKLRINTIFSEKNNMEKLKEIYNSVIDSYEN